MPPPVALGSIRNIAVFCASADGADAAYRTAAVELGIGLAHRNIGIVSCGRHREHWQTRRR
jgi:predicted Rossmann-fold nucleotide-binding protein